MQTRTLIISACSLALCGAMGIAYAASLSAADKAFLITAAKDNMIEAHEGQMAESQATRSDVKDLGKTLDQDHTDAYGKLSELAAKLGVDIPKGINTAHEHTIAQLVSLKGERFDSTYIRDEVASHERTIAMFKREAEHGENADVKAYASQTLPVLEKHLHLAQECAKQPAHKS